MAEKSDAFLAYRARTTKIPHFLIPSSCHLGSIFTRTIRNVGLAMPTVVLLQIASIWHKAWREFLEIPVAQTLPRQLAARIIAELTVPNIKIILEQIPN